MEINIKVNEKGFVDVNLSEDITNSLVALKILNTAVGVILDEIAKPKEPQSEIIPDVKE